MQSNQYANPSLTTSDNFILCPDVIRFSEDGEVTEEILQGAGIRLIDFGRAVDLRAIDNEGDEIVGFFGNAAGQDMECAAMLEERPWKEDIDTFGVCACAHVLLWGTHIKLVKDVKDR